MSNPSPVCLLIQKAYCYILTVLLVPWFLTINMPALQKIKELYKLTTRGQSTLRSVKTLFKHSQLNQLDHPLMSPVCLSVYVC